MMPRHPRQKAVKKESFVDVPVRSAYSISMCRMAPLPLRLVDGSYGVLIDEADSGQAVRRPWY